MTKRPFTDCPAWYIPGHPAANDRSSKVYSRDHFSAISAITPEGKLYLHLQENALDGHDALHFLCHLLRHIPGKLLILWDGATIHYNQAVRRLLATDKNQDLWLERVPAYAPELNPDEGI